MQAVQQVSLGKGLPNDPQEPVAEAVTLLPVVPPCPDCSRCSGHADVVRPDRPQSALPSSAYPIGATSVKIRPYTLGLTWIPPGFPFTTVIHSMAFWRSKKATRRLTRRRDPADERPRGQPADAAAAADDGQPKKRTMHAEAGEGGCWERCAVR